MLRKLSLPDWLEDYPYPLGHSHKWFFCFRYRNAMNKVPDELQVYQILKENITEPGRYLMSQKLWNFWYPGIIFMVIPEITT